MMPNEPTKQPEQHPIDYLDSISTVPKGAKKGPSDKVFFGAIMGGILVAVLVGAFMLLSSGNNKADLTTLSVRLTNLQTVADESRKKTVSSRLRVTNTSLALVLANANRDIGDLLTASGVDPKNIDPKVIAEESTAELNESLEDARLNGTFDRIYAREMAYEIETVLILLEQLESSTKNKEQKEYLATTKANLQPIKENFAKFDATTN